jgi:hypothetical protein
MIDPFGDDACYTMGDASCQGPYLGNTWGYQVSTFSGYYNLPGYENELAQGMAAYNSWMNAVSMTGGNSYLTPGGLILSAGWSIDGGASWQDQNGVNRSDLANEWGLPALAGMQSQSPLLDPIDGFMNNSQRNAARGAVSRAIARLKENANCAAFLGSSAVSALQGDSVGGYWDSDPGNVAQLHGTTIRLNVNGAFFRGSPTSFGYLAPLGLTLYDFQVITILHELGHQMGRLLPDAGDLGKSLINTIKAFQTCAPWDIP